MVVVAVVRKLRYKCITSGRDGRSGHGVSSYTMIGGTSGEGEFSIERVK